MALFLRITNSDLSVNFLVADITTMPTECIVNSVGSDFNLRTAGELARKIAELAGQAVIDQCQQLSGAVSDDVIVTDGGNLPCKWIIHVQNSSVLAEWSNRLRKVLDLAETHGAKSITFPALGSGGCGISRVSMAKVFYHVLTQFASSNPASQRTLQEIRFAFVDQDTLDRYADTFLELNQTNNGAGTISSTLPSLRSTARTRSSVISTGPQHADSSAPRSIDPVAVGSASVTAPASQGIRRTGASAAINSDNINGTILGDVATASPSSRPILTEAVETFECKICFGVARSPVVICNHCNQLIGCGSCVKTLLKCSQPNCPYCRVAWKGSDDYKEFRGLETFLDRLRAHDDA